MDDDKQPTPIGPINLALRWSVQAPGTKRRLKWAVWQERAIERRYQNGSFRTLANYWRAYDGPARNILEALK
jgi:hypothetical protein